MQRQITKTQGFVSCIGNFGVNTRKVAKSKQTEGYLQARKNLLESYWSNFVTLYEELLQFSNSTTEGAEAVAVKEYLSNTEYDSIELIYTENMGELLDAIKAFHTNTQNTPAGTTTITQQATNLPRIKVPTFDGNFLHWYAFKDMFKSVVTENTSVSNTQRLQYLKDALIGDASHVLDNIVTTGANFNVAWDILLKKYENKRIIINSYLTQIVNLPKVDVESASALRIICDGVTAALRALETLERPTAQWDDWLVFLIVNKLDATTRKAWELSLESSDEIPTYEKLSKFLNNRIQSLEIIQLSDGPTSKAKAKTTVKACHTATVSCPICSEKHIVPHCKQFKDSLKKREVAISHKLCFNCLGSGHLLRACPSEKRCSICQEKHNTLMHSVFKRKSDPATVVATSANNVESSASSGSAAATVIANNVVIGTSATPPSVSLPPVLLATAVVEAQGPNEHKQILRALIDNGAEATFISEYAAKQLRLQRIPTKVHVNGAHGANVTCARSLAKFTMRSLRYNFNMESTALVLPKVGNITPSKHIPKTEFSEFSQLELADNKWNQPGSIDIILSAADYAKVLRSDVKYSTTNHLVAQNTHLGWVVFGGLSEQNKMMNRREVECCNTQIDLERTLRLFWEMEEIYERSTLTADEIYCEKLFEQTTRRDKQGRYTVRLPVRQDVDLKLLAPSKADALTLLAHTQRRLDRDPCMCKLYCQFMKEYSDLGHMEVTNDNRPLQVCYLPHHGVYKSSSTTTKLRVVFNAARKYSTGVSLNDCLHTGPKLQNDLASILVNWRRYRFAFTGDIEKMYRQILVDRDDVNLQRIFWQAENVGEPTCYTLLTVTYGTNCAPYLALKVLRQLATDERGNFPDAAKTLDTEFYVDDVLSGDDTLEKVVHKLQQVKTLLQTGGFLLRKFNSNNVEVLNSVELCDRDTSNSVEVTMDDQTKALGIVWLTQSDTFTYNITLDYNITCFNKRQLASDVARIFDPLGLVTPVTVKGKIFLQQLWHRKLDWNEELPAELNRKWNTYRRDLQQLEKLRIPRWIGTTEGSTIELHTFADASKVAYAAAVFAKVNHANRTYVNLLMAKTKVAPLKEMSIPRLELCAAGLAAKLFVKVKEALPIKITRYILWTDSINTLCWIRSSPGKLKQFVANRVKQIQTITDSSDWRYIGTTDNPADCASRGIPAGKLLSHSLWWNGPAWLAFDEQQWPKYTINFPESVPETCDVIGCVSQIEKHDWIHVLLTRFSSLDKLIVVVGWCLRFVNNCCKRSNTMSKYCTWPERYTALKMLVKVTQKAEFETEISTLQQQRELLRTSKLRKLNIIIDSEGILRLRGRLQKIDMPLNARCPMIMPKQHPLTTLIVQHVHRQCLHGGTQTTLGHLRRQFWVINGRTEVKRVISNCVKCFRHNCSPQQQLMGDLPVVRYSITLPFLHTGVDYAGPFNIRATKGRGHKSYKGYVALFVCLATKGIHLELVSDMTKETFILALERFVAARGICSDMYSDRGTTFVGADALLKEELNAFHQQLNAAASYTSQRGINWHFIPPGAPNFGGLWEAGVKSMKMLLKKIVNTATLTFEEFYTVLKRVEACLNSRPLAALTDDPSDLDVLTPGHLLIGRPLTSVPEPNLLDTKTGVLCRWKQLSQIHQEFWRRWSLEYVQQLQVRTKWHKRQQNVTIGQLVLVRDEKSPPGQWILGRIIAVHPGNDGLVRVVTLKTATTTMKRPISKISVLPIATE